MFCFYSVHYLRIISFLPLDMAGIYKAMGEMEHLAKQAMDILECRIEAVLEDMSLTPLCDLPEDDSISIEEFLKLTEETCLEASQSLAK